MNTEQVKCVVIARDELKNHKVDGRKIHRLLRCQNCQKSVISRSTNEKIPNQHFAVFINRDINAAVNMLSIVKSVVAGHGTTRGI